MAMIESVIHAGLTVSFSALVLILWMERERLRAIERQDRSPRPA